MQCFGIDEPKTIPEADKARLRFLSQFNNLRDALLTKHRLMLRPIDGIGYRVVHPEHQTETAVKDRGAAIKRELSHLVQELSHVRTEALTDDQRKVNADALSKMGTLAGLVGKQLRIAKPQESL